MINRRSVLFRSTAMVVCLTTTAMSTMLFAYPRKAAPPHPDPPAKKAPKSHVLSDKEMLKAMGKDAANPYVSGVSRQSIVVNGVDVMTGNFSTSATDLSFEGGYGIPVAVTRTYNSNCGIEGPMGRGWTLSVDMRSTAGGLLKGSKSADLSTPVEVHECPPGLFHLSNEGNDNTPSNEGAVTVDASGKENILNREVDGVMMGALADKNLYETEYEDVTSGDDVYQVIKKQIVTTPEDTVIVYEAEGSYEGIHAYDHYQSGGTGSTGVSGSTGSTAGTGGPEGALYAEEFTDPVEIPTNILKITSITDRHQNVTTFTYNGSVTYTFHNTDGDSDEHPLTSVTMPGGRELDFTWTNIGSTIPRITAVTDGTRTVDYTYQGADSDLDGMLQVVDTPVARLAAGDRRNMDTNIQPLSSSTRKRR